MKLEEVRKQYEESSHYLDVNYNLMFDEGIVNPTLDRRKTFARWFYNANQEWFKDFQKVKEEYLTKNGGEIETISRWEEALKTKMKFYDNRRAFEGLDEVD